MSIPDVPAELEGKDITLKGGKWVEVEKAAEPAKPPVETKPAKSDDGPPELKKMPTLPAAPKASKPKAAKSKPAESKPAAAKPAEAPKPKTDPKTDETAAELIERAEMESSKHKAHALAAQLFKRAAALVEGKEAEKLLARAESESKQAQAKGQKEPIMTTEKSKEKAEKKAKPAKAKPKTEKKAKPAKKEAKTKAASNGHNGVAKHFKPGEGNEDHHGYPRTEAQKKAAHERTLASVAAMRKGELSDDDKAFMKAIARSPKTLAEIGEECWPRLSAAARYLKAKNAKRKPVAQKLCKLTTVERDGREFHAYERV